MKRHFYPSAKKRKTCVIGVAGSQSGCGATHFILCSANYLSNVMGEKTAVLNFTGKKDYRQAQIILTNTDEKREQFEYAGIRFYEAETHRDIFTFENSYDYLLLDLGSDFDVFREDFFRCDIKILYGTLNQWNLRSFITRAIQLKQLCPAGTFESICSFYYDAGKKVFSRAVGEKLHIMPFEPDPFKLHKDSLDFLKQLFDKE